MELPISSLIGSADTGQRLAADALFAALYSELRGMANLNWLVAGRGPSFTTNGEYRQATGSSGPSRPAGGAAGGERRQVTHPSARSSRPDMTHGASSTENEPSNLATSNRDLVKCRWRDDLDLSHTGASPNHTAATTSRGQNRTPIRGQNATAIDNTPLSGTVALRPWRSCADSEQRGAAAR